MPTQQRKFGKTIADLLEYIKGFDPSTPFLVCSDEEMNSLYQEFEVADIGNGKVAIYGLSGTELEE